MFVGAYGTRSESQRMKFTDGVNEWSNDNMRELRRCVSRFDGDVDGLVGQLKMRCNSRNVEHNKDTVEKKNKCNTRKKGRKRQSHAKEANTVMC